MNEYYIPYQKPSKTSRKKNNDNIKRDVRIKNANLSKFAKKFANVL